MAARNERPEYHIQPNSSQKGSTTKAELGDDLPKHLSSLPKCTWHLEVWWRCLCPPVPGRFNLLGQGSMG